jgi:hypothetical protein
VEHEKTYEDGKREAEMNALRQRVDGLHTEMREGFNKFMMEIDTLKKAVWLLYGAIALVGFILPLLQKMFNLG